MPDTLHTLEFDIQGVDDWRNTTSMLRVPLAIDAGNGAEEFRAKMRSLSVGGVRIMTLSASAHRSAGIQRSLTTESEAYYVLVYQVVGMSRLSQAQRTAELARGDLALFDTLMPYRRELVGGSALIMMIPQQLLSLPPRALAQIGGLRISGNGGLGAVLSPLLSGIAANLPSLERPGGLVFVQSIVRMVAACVLDELELSSDNDTGARLELLVRIREYILEHLGDLDLNPQRIADAHYISIRSLHALFKDQGSTVSTWIRERRLEMARRDLVNPHCTDAIRDIGLRWGFADATHFSNAFRLAYSKSPREYRKFAREAANLITD